MRIDHRNIYHDTFNIHFRTLNFYKFNPSHVTKWKMYVIHQCITWLVHMYYPKEDFVALQRSFLGIHTSSIDVLHEWNDKWISIDGR